MYLYLCSNTKNDRNVTINVQVVLIGVLMLICFEISTGHTQCYSTLYTPKHCKNCRHQALLQFSSCPRSQFMGQKGIQ